MFSLKSAVSKAAAFKYTVGAFQMAKAAARICFSPLPSPPTYPLFSTAQFTRTVYYTKELRPVPDDYRIPDYMQDIYTWCYVKPVNVKALDRQLVVQTILFGYFQPLANMVCDELKPGQSILQTGSTYGKLIETVCKKLGPDGTYNICDIMPIQVRPSPFLSLVGRLRQP